MKFCTETEILMDAIFSCRHHIPTIFSLFLSSRLGRMRACVRVSVFMFDCVYPYDIWEASNCRAIQWAILHFVWHVVYISNIRHFFAGKFRILTSNSPNLAKHWNIEQNEPFTVKFHTLERFPHSKSHYEENILCILCYKYLITVEKTHLNTMIMA